MTILVTGANGQLGRSVCERLAAADTPYLGLGSGALDIGDPAAVAARFNGEDYTAIINCAAYTAVDKAESEPELAYRVNQQGAVHLAAAALAANIPLLHVSTDYVFDGSKQGPYTPEDATNPLGVYGASKLAGEQAIAASGCRYLIVRTAWVFSEHGNNFVKTMLRLGAQRDELSIVADQVGSPTYAGDLAELLIKATVNMQAGPSAIDDKVVHFGGTPACSWYEFAQAIFAAAQQADQLQQPPRLKPIATSDYPTAARRPANSTLNSVAIEQLLNLPCCHWQIGLENTVKG